MSRCAYMRRQGTRGVGRAGRSRHLLRHDSSPHQTVSTPEQGVADLPGSYFGITGDSFGVTGSDAALDWALDICNALQGHPLVIPAERRSLYHAAAVMASNYIVAIIDAAAALLVEAGVEPDRALPALAPRSGQRPQHVEYRTSPGSNRTHRTGRYANRGVAPTGPSRSAESVRHLYRSAGLHALEIARRKSPDVDRGSIESLLRENQKINP